MLIKKVYKFRLLPNKEQKTFFAQAFGCARFVWNKMLADKIEHYEQTGKMLYNTPAQYKDEFEFLKETDSLSLANVQLNLEAAFTNFFRKPGIVGFPRFKAKHYSRQKYKTNNQSDNIRIEGNKIKLPKVGWVKVKNHRTINSKIKNVTITKNPSGNYYVSILVEEQKPKQLPKNNNIIGIDLGLTDFITTSDGEKVKSPKFLKKSEKRIKFLQKSLSRKQKGSNNRNKARIKLACVHEKITNQRNDFLHKLSMSLINENQVICVETLKISNMMKNRRLSKSIADVSWHEFIRQLTYKADWYGRQIVKIDTFFPSSKLCSNCGHKQEKMPLHIRNWTCPECDCVHDRDINAAINIRTEGISGIACDNL